jgi:hypothetical protein
MDDDFRWPMDFEHKPGRGPNLVFRPEGFLVAMLVGAEEAATAASSLMAAGYTENDLQLYTSAEILANHERYVRDRTVPERLAGVVTDDTEARELYLSYARQGRCALWIHIPDERHVDAALRVLAHHAYVHVRYYGRNGVYDVRLGLEV